MIDCINYSIFRCAGSATCFFRATSDNTLIPHCEICKQYFSMDIYFLPHSKELMDEYTIQKVMES